MSYSDDKFPTGSNGKGGNMQKRPAPRRPSRTDGDFGGRPQELFNSAFIVEITISALLIAVVCAFRLAGLFSGEAPFDATVFIFFAAGLVVFAALRWFMRKPYYAGVIAAFLTFLVAKFDWLEGLARLIMGERYALAGGITFCFVFASLFCLLIYALYNKDFSLRIFAGAASAALCCVVVFSAVLSLAGGAPAPTTSLAVVTPSPTVKATPSPTIEPTPTPIPTPEPFGLPNVYFFVLDEYSTFDILKKYYKYDNKVFENYLNAKGFNISRVSYSTDTQTEHSLCDTLNLSYISRHYTKSKCFSKIRSSKLYNIFKDLGYTQFQYSTSSEHFGKAISLKTSSGRKKLDAIKTSDSPGITTISSDIQTVLSNYKPRKKVSASKLNEWGVYPSKYIRKQSRYRNGAHADDLLDIFDYFNNPANYPVTSPRVTYSYMSSNHVAFVFDEFGGLLPSSRARDWRTEDVYLGQYKFVTKQMMSIFNTIINNDPNSIIIIQCDHGIRYHADCALIHKFYISDKDSCRIMNAVYVKGQKLDIEGLSAINTMRAILNLYPGMDYKPIKDPITTKSPKNLSGIIPRHRPPYKAPAKPKATKKPDPEPPAVPGGGS